MENNRVKQPGLAFKCLFSIPVWLLFNLSTAILFSRGFRNFALMGESGMKMAMTMPQAQHSAPMMMNS